MSFIFFENGVNVMICYHGTTKEKAELILKNGFELSKYGDFGEGIYLSPDYNIASLYGETIIKCYINDSNIIETNLANIGEIGRKNVSKQMKKEDIKCLNITGHYKSDFEILVLDKNLIEIIEIKKSKRR